MSWPEPVQGWRSGGFKGIFRIRALLHQVPLMWSLWLVLIYKHLCLVNSSKRRGPLKLCELLRTTGLDPKNCSHVVMASDRRRRLGLVYWPAVYKISALRGAQEFGRLAHGNKQQALCLTPYLCLRAGWVEVQDHQSSRGGLDMPDSQSKQTYNQDEPVTWGYMYLCLEYITGAHGKKTRSRSTLFTLDEQVKQLKRARGSLSEYLTHLSMR